ncbi:MAG: hypothetical protein B6U97_04170 [Candidatus Altiarchaeales archaeon ex4484_96]|nr:MAG: hypothetical protein B6U97_04170 [Candidatus Altiarchaeales archaeon ex4484_96]
MEVKNMNIKKLLKNNKGIETRVLVFVLGAVVLILMLSLVMSMYVETEQLVGQAIIKANETLNATGSI